MTRKTYEFVWKGCYLGSTQAPMTRAELAEQLMRAGLPPAIRKAGVDVRKRDVRQIGQLPFVDTAQASTRLAA